MEHGSVDMDLGITVGPVVGLAASGRTRSVVRG